MKEFSNIKKIKLANTQDGIISVGVIKNPYNDNNEKVVSIGISLNGEEISWKTHIPFENIDEVIEAIKEAKENS